MTREEEALNRLEFERKWLSDAGYNAYNVDVAFNSIRTMIKILFRDEQETVLDEIVAEIIEEKDLAYSDFERYKVECLGVDAEYAEDELPQDDFRYGMERAIEIINNYKVESEGT